MHIYVTNSPYLAPVFHYSNICMTTILLFVIIPKYIQQYFYYFRNSIVIHHFGFPATQFCASAMLLLLIAGKYSALFWGCPRVA